MKLDNPFTFRKSKIIQTENNNYVKQLIFATYLVDITSILSLSKAILNCTMKNILQPKNKLKS